MIGISSKNAKAGDYWIESLIKEGFRLIEINHRATSLGFGDKDIKEMKKKY